MSYKCHILSFGSHWGTEMHVLNISKNAFHSIPRQGFSNIWLEMRYTKNALYSEWCGSLGLDYQQTIIIISKMRIWVLGKLATIGSWNPGLCSSVGHPRGVLSARYPEKSDWGLTTSGVRWTLGGFSWRSVEGKAEIGQWASSAFSVQRAGKHPFPWSEGRGSIWGQVDDSWLRSQTCRPMEYRKCVACT